MAAIIHPLSLWETTAWMQEVEQRREQLSRVRVRAGCRRVACSDSPLPSFPRRRESRGFVFATRFEVYGAARRSGLSGGARRAPTGERQQQQHLVQFAALIAFYACYLSYRNTVSNMSFVME